MEIAVSWEQMMVWAGAGSLLTLVVTLIAVPWVITRLPRDYFSRERRAVWRQSNGEPLPAIALGLLKNVLGAALVLSGVVMLLTPGQGILTLLAGLLLMNFPGKYRLERWLVMRPGVLRALNWLRDRRGQAPFQAPGVSSADI